MLDARKKTKGCTVGKTGWSLTLASHSINHQSFRGERGAREPCFNAKAFALEVLKNPNVSVSGLAKQKRWDGGRAGQ